MKYLAALFVALMVTAGMYPVVVKQSDELTKQERFALELETCQQAWASGTPGKCELYGRIEIVDHFPDVKIQMVDHFPDIKVQWVDHFADGPGKWKEVNNFPDYKVQIVDHFPDYKVQLVDHFPGCT